MAGGTLIREFFARLGLQLDPQAMQDLEEFDQALTDAVGAVKTVGIAATVAAGGVWALVHSTAAAGDEAAKNAQRLGITAEEYQRLAFAAEMSGTSVDALGAAFRTMGKVAVEAEGGSKSARETLALLGIESRNAAGQMRSNGDLFREAAERLSGMENGAHKNALAMRIFGQSALDLVPLLNSGQKGIAELMAEADSLGIVLSNDIAAQSEVFGDELTRIGKAIIGVRNAVGSALLPQMTEMLSAFRAWFAANRQIISQRLESIMRGVAQALALLGHALTPILALFDRASSAAGDFGMWLKFALAALLAFHGTNVILPMLSLIRMAFSSGGLAASLFGNAALIAQIKATAGFWAIVAAVAAVLLIIDDLYAYSQGGRSFLGPWLEGSAMGRQVLALFVQVQAAFTALWPLIRTIGGAWLTFFIAWQTRVLGLIAALLRFNARVMAVGLTLLTSLWALLASWLAQLAGAADAWLSPIADTISAWLSGVVDGARELLGGLWTWIAERLISLFAPMEALGAYLAKLTGIDLGAVGTGLAKLTGIDLGAVGTGLAEAFSGLGTDLTAVATGRLLTTSTGADPGRVGNDAPVNNGAVNINLTLPPGADAAAVGRSAARGAQDGLIRALRAATANRPATAR